MSLDYDLNQFKIKYIIMVFQKKAETLKYHAKYDYKWHMVYNKFLLCDFINVP